MLYVDISKNFDYLNYLDDVIDENTITILKYKQPVVPGMLPSFIKNNYENYTEDCFRFGDWDNVHKYNSEYYLVFN